ncbi:hypothetical protein [Williamsia sp. 1135]|uniref:hypothetical protein n=1 Tax=Williamsia sp. 1135 TaxID=1889262 RepID=UPI000A102C6E|nr:hypothetical protein [Williamsia sp. 1135]ORM35504.1 hypothetical protein BFL43_09290 [Williamsia sp. 1135]
MTTQVAASAAADGGIWDWVVLCASLIAVISTMWWIARVGFGRRDCHPQTRPRGTQMLITAAYVLMTGVWIVALGGNLLALARWS